jgi:anthranilate phosphoribosyltransferase
MSLEQVLHKLADGQSLSADEAHGAFSAVMDGQASEVEIASLLTALRVKGEGVEEIVGAARAMRERVLPIPVKPGKLLDTCGTGGDELQTFNISTAAAFVAAAAGVHVAKHGNRSVSSSSGSADVLEQLGVNITLPPDRVAHSLRETHLGFCFAPLLHGAMKHAGPVRKLLKFRTIFNLLGPLTNPAGAGYQLLGTGRNAAAEKLALAMAMLGTQHALVVCGANQLDEVSTWGKTRVYEVRGNSVNWFEWTSESFGVAEGRPEDLRVSNAAESAAMIRRVLAGEPGPAREIVVANAAAALLAADHAPDPLAAAQAARSALDDGRAADVLRRLAESSHG